MLNFNGIYVFSACCEHLSFRATAEHLHITQSAVAQRIRQLEAHLGVQLFIRTPKGLTFTTVGQSYYQNIKDSFQTIERATVECQSVPDSIRITTTPSFAACWLLPRLSILQRVICRDVELRAGNDLVDLNAGEADIAIRLSQVSQQTHHRAVLLTTPDLYLVTYPADPIIDVYQQGLLQNQESGFVIEGALQEHLQRAVLIVDIHCRWETLVKPSEPNTQTQSLLPLVQQRLKLSHTSLAIAAAKTGQGMTLVPQLFVADEIKAGALVVLETMKQHTLGFYLLATPTTSEALFDQLLEWLKSESELTAALSNFA